MIDFILGLRIRVKLLTAFGSILLLSVLLIFFSVDSINRILYYKAINEDVDLLKQRLDALDLAYKDFMYEDYKAPEFLEQGVSETVQAFNENHTTARATLEHILATQKGDDENLLQTLDSLRDDFETLVELLRKRGFKDYGLEGSLRSAIHSVENSGFEFDMVSMLMLRRHEKDFFLRKDLKYQDDFNKRFDGFRSQLMADASPDLVVSLDNYRSEFNKVVDIEKQIGLHVREGIRGRIQNYFTQLSPRVEALRRSVKDENERQIISTRWVLWIIFLVQIAAGIGMALFYAGLLTRSIKEIRNGMQQLAAGVFPEKLTVKSQEEIGQTKAAFNQFIDRLKAATEFAGALGAGQQTVAYSQQYADDVLAQSLVRAQEQLLQADARQKKVNWLNEGAARFSEILKQDEEDLAALGERILKLLVTYLNANQGALYVLNGDGADRELQRIATYAYGKKKFVEERVQARRGGLLGQAVLGGETLYLTDVPADYIRITSGLGEATPRSVLIVPLTFRSRVMGVAELASFRTLEAHQVEFVERMSENIATLLASRQDAANTKRLLEESRQKADALAQQEEAMRQNAEELQATQEEMERQRAARDQEIAELKEKLEQVTTTDVRRAPVNGRVQAYSNH